ncbi:uncharacterized mitochondrial protein AtMg00810-like [Rhodamnia argentea]|uniref:Uncharacterized mitochondrial protein AtMg00810-like n=1 Tax=Rhodamnia argentea TaxID=178133 RepID=A0ABM3HGN1_9MYRT|nr:uncharacterized mitochondrial protein AtMg00810-like [Rhodamnia argentea]
MYEELCALGCTGMWDLVPLQPGKSLISCRWICKIKTHSDGSIKLYKAHLVARDFDREYEIDYEETFAPIAKMAYVRGTLYAATSRSGSFCWLDVIRSADFVQSENDHAVFTHTSPASCTILLLYVNDMIITRDDFAHITYTKQYLHRRFAMTDLGLLRYFLGIEVARSRLSILLSQQKYISDILARVELSDTHTAATLVELHLRLRAGYGEPMSNVTCYRALVGGLGYLMTIRSNIAYAVHLVSRFVAVPRIVHYVVVLRILRYLRGTMTRSFFLPSTSSLAIRAYYDADWASNVTDRKSITGFCVFLGDSLISWCAKKQTVVSCFSTESEYRAMVDTTVDIIWLCRLLADLGIGSSAPIPLHCDNKSSIHITTNPVFHERTKYIDIDCHITRHQLQARIISLPFVAYVAQLTDLFTKSLTS